MHLYPNEYSTDEPISEPWKRCYEQPMRNLQIPIYKHEITKPTIDRVYASITMVLNSFKIYYIDLINVFIEAQFPKFLFNHFQHWWRMEWVKKSNSINLYKKVEKRRYPLRGLTFTFIHNSIGNISQRSIVAFNDYIWHFKFFYVIPIRTSKYASAICYGKIRFVVEYR